MTRPSYPIRRTRAARSSTAGRRTPAVRPLPACRKAAGATLVAVTALSVALLPTAASALGGPGHENGGGSGGTDGKGGLIASVTDSQIRVTAPDAPKGVPVGSVTSTDPDWEPPVCWYEPVFTPEQLKRSVDGLDGMGAVNAHEWWTKGLFVDHYDKGEPADNFDINDGSGGNSTAEGYRNYNIGEQGKFWRSVVRKGHEDDQKAWDCGRVMFWQDAGTIPDDPHAPRPKTLAAFAYDHIEVPETEVELRPAARSTVNLPTWVWLDKGVFKDVTVRASLDEVGVWAETTARPVSLHLEPGTEDAETFPASGECEVAEDGSIGAPYTKGSSEKSPPCGIRYLRKGDFDLKASVTWEITWKGSQNTGGDLPDGTFETTQDLNVREIQSVNR